MCAYLSNAEDQFSEAMKKAVRKVYEPRKWVSERIRSIAKAYKTHRGTSAHEDIAIALPEIWLHKTCPGLTFANTKLPEKRFRICRNEAVYRLCQLTVKIWLSEIWLIVRKDSLNKKFLNWSYQIVDKINYAEFLSKYYVDFKNKQAIDNEPTVELQMGALTDNSINDKNLPKKILLMHSKEILKLRNKKYILSYHVLKHRIISNSYAHQLWFMSFSSFRNEFDLKTLHSVIYFEKIYEPSVIQPDSQKRRICEPFNDDVDAAFVDFIANLLSMDPQVDQEMI